MISEDFYVLSLGLAGLPVLAHVVAELLTSGRGAAEADSRDVNEHIRTAIVRGDESEAFVLGKKLYGTSG